MIIVNLHDKIVNLLDRIIENLQDKSENLLDRIIENLQDKSENLHDKSENLQDRIIEMIIEMTTEMPHMKIVEMTIVNLHVNNPKVIKIIAMIIKDHQNKINITIAMIIEMTIGNHLEIIIVTTVNHLSKNIFLHNNKVTYMLLPQKMVTHMELVHRNQNLKIFQLFVIQIMNFLNLFQILLLPDIHQM